MYTERPSKNADFLAKKNKGERVVTYVGFQRVITFGNKGGRGSDI